MKGGFYNKDNLRFCERYKEYYCQDEENDDIINIYNDVKNMLIEKANRFNKYIEDYNSKLEELVKSTHPNILDIYKIYKYDNKIKELSEDLQKEFNPKKTVSIKQNLEHLIDEKTKLSDSIKNIHFNEKLLKEHSGYIESLISEKKNVMKINV
jgi:hypothetical protein